MRSLRRGEGSKDAWGITVSDMTIMRTTSLREGKRNGTGGLGPRKARIILRV
jgi:hypothetical protein